MTLSGPGAGTGPSTGQELLPGHGGREVGRNLHVGRGALQEPGVDTGCHPQGAARVEGAGLATARDT